MPPLIIGVLALQGAFQKHIDMIQQLGHVAKEVKKPIDLLNCDGLIIPGGESTTMMHQIDYIQLKEPLIEFADKKPVFGTCAGLILMSSEILRDTMKPFHLLNVSVERNAFGRQAESFSTDIELQKERKIKTLPALFIRAPRIRSVGENVQVLGTFKDEPVLVQQGKYLGATFHPELTQNTYVHSHFINMIRNNSAI